MKNKVRVLERNIRYNIYNVDGYSVITDKDLANLYGTDFNSFLILIKKHAEKFDNETMLMVEGNEAKKIMGEWHDCKMPKRKVETGIKTLNGKLSNNVAVNSKDKNPMALFKLSVINNPMETLDDAKHMDISTYNMVAYGELAEELGKKEKEGHLATVEGNFVDGIDGNSQVEFVASKVDIKQIKFEL